MLGTLKVPPKPNVRALPPSEEVPAVMELVWPILLFVISKPRSAAIFKVTLPLVPPPVRPLPAVTPVIVPMVSGRLDTLFLSAVV